ncbi:MAG: hypothetical protein WCL44_07955 [bacterium]
MRLPLFLGTAACAVFLSSVSAYSQMPPPMDGFEGSVPEAESVRAPASSRSTGVVPAYAAATDEWPEHRNPFWPIGLSKASSPGNTNRTADASVETAPRNAVDWKGATKYVKDNATVSLMGRIIIVVLDGEMYEIGQVLEVTLNGNVYAFKLLGGSGEIKLEQLRVHPAEKKADGVGNQENDGG